MMDELGLAYLDTGHYQEGIVLYKDLSAATAATKSCVYQAQITDATLAHEVRRQGRRS